jgi:hypothetical protein
VDLYELLAHPVVDEHGETYQVCACVCLFDALCYGWLCAALAYNDVRALPIR